ncbi:MAG: RluA family pseudouridine synthase [Epsilonproteobacteria bacterium]|nr:RluA family pseudouridine synthase [Campylobacterota bacterium]
MKLKADTNNIRIDKFLSNKLQIARNQIDQLIKKGAVRLNSSPVKKGGVKLKEGDTVEIDFPQKQSSPKKEVDFDIPVLYEDENLLVINKPPGIVVHPAPSVKDLTVVEWLKSKGFSLSTIAGDERFGIVHRIDKETSGALIIAKDNKTHAFLSEQLKDKTLGRYYVMLLNMPLKEPKCVNKPISRNPKDRKKMAVIEGGKDAKTLFVPIKDNLCAAKLYTGRTHQIRVHLKSIGRYIKGDETYGKKDAKRVMLHARELYFLHPNGKKLSIIAPLFDDFKSEGGIDEKEIVNIGDCFSDFERLCQH